VTYDDKWSRSSLSFQLKPPQTELARENYEKRIALKIMSLDLNTTEQIVPQNQKKN